MVRFKNRYLVVELVPDEGHKDVANLQFKSNEVYQAISTITEQMHGEFGCASIQNGLEVKYFSKYVQIAIIRCRHGPHRLLASSLPFLSKVGKVKTKCHSIYTGATLVHCWKFLQRYHKDRICEALKNCSSDIEKKKIYDVLSKLDFTDKIKKKS